MQYGKIDKVRCPNPRCRNIIIEPAHVGNGRFVVRYKQIRLIRGKPHVMCKICGTAWIEIPREMI